ncbi:MAG: efflux RND transporter periplasmic adaptor subunit [Planctomycetota bacterium]|jgi:RND family efflux transporter MFP subunit
MIPRLTILLLCLLLACSPPAAKADESRPEQGTSGGREVNAKTPVVVEALQVGPVRDEIVVSAKVASRTVVQIFPKLSNLAVTAVHVEEGDRVVEGQVLAELFADNLQLQQQTADAVLSETAHQITRDEVERDQAASRVVTAQRLAEKTQADYERLAGLGDLVNRQERDDKQLAAENAQDELALAELAQRSAAISLELAKISVRKAEIEVERTRTDLGYAKVRAPIAGVISRRSIQQGELSSLAAPMFILTDTSNLVLNLRVPQDALGRLGPGQPVEARAVTGPVATFHGVVRSVNPVLDDATGTVHAIVDLEPDERLAPGLFCEARIITSAREDALLVSKRAVLYEDDQPVLFAVNGDDAARKIPFIAGASTPTAVEILSDLDGAALPPDLRVIVVGQENLKDGAPIRIVEEAF